MTRSPRWLALSGILALLATPACAAGGKPAPESGAATSLDESTFRNPPQEARPHVWWHWLNGNISEEGITKDLEWMKRAGIGGVQTFDVNFQTPDVVANRLGYMSPDWKAAFRHATQEADRLGLDLTVASSPGWSLTGGPWVKPENGLKKVVWSETEVEGGRTQTIRLAQPPTVSGPFQDIPLKPEPGADPKHVSPEYYRDIAILAFRASPAKPLPSPGYRLQDGKQMDAVQLTDGKLTDGETIRSDSQGGAAITMEFAAPQTVQSLVTHVPGAADMFTGPAADMVLESSSDGAAWSKVAQFQPTLAPSTISFAPATARLFRLRMTAIDTGSPIDLLSAPGYAGVNYALFLKQMPLKLAELRLLPDARLDQFEAKAGFGIAQDYFALSAPASDANAGTPRDQVIDLTGRLRADGTLDWRPAPGHWRVLRLGWSLTGKTNHPAPAEATGLEVDKIDGAAVRDYMKAYLASYRDTVGPDLIGARGINAVLTDSTEVGAFNWTPGLIDAFKRRRGYDPKPWLPTLTGTVVGSRADSDRFLYDFRRTIAEMHASEHYGAVAEVAHAAGLKVYGEALEGWRVSLGDDIDMRRHTDVPMAAMWAFPQGIGPRPLLVADIRTAASSAHLRGQPYVAAESLTSSRFPWAMGPAELRRVVDTEFANGVNRVIIHTSPHQPVDDKRPGLSLRHIGQFFTRHETWAEMARPWIDYIARSSHLLQQGRFVADVAYFPGEEASAPTLVAQGRLNDLPRRHGYDFVNATALLEDLSVRDGDLVSKGGARYRVLNLGGTSQRMTLPVLRRIHRLASDGATIVGQAPQSTPSLADNEREFARLARRMWRDGAATRIGKGRVMTGVSAEHALAALRIAPDFTDAANSSDLEFVHRKLTDADVYFVRNASTQPRTVSARFRVAGKAPELWDAVTATTRPLTYRIEGGATQVPLTLAGEQSVFVVFRKKADKPQRTVAEPAATPIVRLDADWSVQFEPGRGAPAQEAMTNLVPLNEHAEPGIRYFSGTATYSTTFTLSADQSGGKALLLDLGKVGDIAEVWINGKLVGTTWQTPHRLDISGKAVAGLNTLQVKVANLWANRLIGDAQPGARKIGWTAAPMYKADAPLRPSGLIGPVTLLGAAVP